jgi:ParB/RepB/Spo0J family partition protein
MTRAHVPPRADVPDLERCLELGIDPNDPASPRYGDRKESHPMTDQSIQMLELANVRESSSNPRKTFLDVESLACDLKLHGMLQPVLVRPGNGKGGYELVFGARRLRAAKLAGLERVPAMVRELDDAKVLELQIVENSQRSDVHPLEEAEGYERLHMQHGLSVDDIAAKVNKSAAAIYARMKLCALAPDARRAFYAGRLTASTALYVARVPPSLQGELLADIEAEARDGLPWEDRRKKDVVPAPLGARNVFEIVQHKYMLRLSDAPFDVKDAELVGQAGPCSTCPKRTGAQPELFADVSNRDICTDPACFGTKKKAHYARLLDRAESEGKRVATAKEAKKLFPYRGATLDYGSDKVLLDTKCNEDPKRRTYRALLKGSSAEILVAQDPYGAVHELASKAAVVKALREAGVKGVQEGRLPRDGDEARRRADGKRAAAQQKKKRAPITALISAVTEKAETSPVDAAWWRFIVTAVASQSWNDVEKDVLKRRGLDAKTRRGGGDYGPRFKASLDLLAGANANQLRGLLVELAVTKGAYFTYRMGLTANLVKACEYYGIDQRKVEKGIGEEKPAKPAKKAAKK